VEQRVGRQRQELLQPLAEGARDHRRLLGDMTASHGHVRGVRVLSLELQLKNRDAIVNAQDQSGTPSVSGLPSTRADRGNHGRPVLTP
jgi:hypothetical protein